MTRRFLSLLALAALVGPAHADDASVLTETSLRASPDSTQISGFVTAGTAVDVIERSGAWARVRIEGWVRADALSEAAASPARAAPEPLPVTGGGETRAGVPVEGFIRAKLGRFKKLEAKQEPVLLLPAGFEPTEFNSETEARLAELEAEAARLKREAEIAMHDRNFYKATSTRDDLMKERDVLLAERQEILNVRHGRDEANARRIALVSATTDSKGWFSMSSVAPGTYTLYARLTRDDLDLEWLEELTVGTEPVRIELDESRARGMLPAPKKK